jgi:hypothetical protein
MNFSAHIGSFFLAPFMFASSFFGGHHAAMNHAPTTSLAHDARATQHAKTADEKNLPAWQRDWQEWWSDHGRRATTTPATTTAAAISSIDPSSGPVGTDVTLTGSGFTDSDVVRFGGAAVSSTTVSDDGTTLAFTVPESGGPYCKPGMPCPLYLLLIRPGSYNVSVTDGTTTSNAVRFQVTSTTTPPAPAPAPVSVSGIDGPATLAAGATGTWTVDAALASTTGNLHYSVKWGDEGIFRAMALMAVPAVTQSSATFTHAYASAGTYHPTFTVADDDGHSATVSESVVVRAP